MRKDRNIFGGVLSLINEDFPSKQIHIKQLKELEPIFIENFLSGLSFTNIRDSQDNRGERGTFYKFSLLLPLFSEALRHYLDLDIGRTIGRLLQRAYLRTLVAAGLEPLFSERKSLLSTPLFRALKTSEMNFRKQE